MRKPYKEVQRLKVKEVKFRRRRLTLRRTLTLTLERVSRWWTVKATDLPSVLGAYQSRDGAVRDWMHDFIVAYDGLVGELDEHLTKDAISLRDRLASLVVSDSRKKKGCGQ